MPESEALQSDNLASSLTKEQLQERSQQEWIQIEARSRKLIQRSLRDKNTPARAISEVMRAGAVAREQAYPDAANSGLSVNVPARLLKPIEQAIRGVEKKKSGGIKDTVKSEAIEKVEE